MTEQPIIKKVIKKAGHGHHGGAWKIAYADFVTAMMAFFLLMWLLGTTDEKTRKGISDYFNDPYGVHVSSSGEGVANRDNIIQGGGEDLSSQSPGQTHPDQNAAQPASLEDAQKLAEAEEKQQLDQLQEKIQNMVEASPEISPYKEQIKLEQTPEGLKIQIIDAQNRAMFQLASSHIADYAQQILRKLAAVINELPNKVTVNGHTDALPYPNNTMGYSNWDLSSDRANVARRELTTGGLAEDKVLRVIGLASSIPYKPEQPNDPMNRRISIIVMNKKAEAQVLHDGLTLDSPEDSQQVKGQAP